MLQSTAIFWLTVVVAVAYSSSSSVAIAFTVVGTTPSRSSSLLNNESALFLAKKRTGRLGSEVEILQAPTVKRTAASTKKKQTKKTSSNNKKTTTTEDASISPDLAKWISTKESVSSTTTTTTTTTDDNDDTTTGPAVIAPSAASFTSFDEKTNNKKSDRRVKQSARLLAEEQRQAAIQLLVEELETTLKESKGNLDAILKPIQKLIQSGLDKDMNMKQLTGNKSKRLNYRLAWVGSDDTVCHMCTGLHKVPLARLDEVFLSFKGRNRIELREVIRILGPFPNVCNVLQGSTEIVAGATNAVTDWNVIWDSMIDGTGKELLAGKAENTRLVNLHVYFRDENALVLVVPPDTSKLQTKRNDPLEENGQHVMVFVKEDEMDEKLEKMRVA